VSLIAFFLSGEFNHVIVEFNHVSGEFNHV
jgi:hypothetical protein